MLGISGDLSKINKFSKISSLVLGKLKNNKLKLNRPLDSLFYACLSKTSQSSQETTLGREKVDFQLQFINEETLKEASSALAIEDIPSQNLGLEYEEGGKVRVEVFPSPQGVIREPLLTKVAKKSFKLGLGATLLGEFSKEASAPIVPMSQFQLYEQGLAPSEEDLDNGLGGTRVMETLKSLVFKDLAISSLRVFYPGPGWIFQASPGLIGG